MKTIDMRFDPELIRNLIGKTFIEYRCDAFDFTNSVTQIVGLSIGGKVYALTNVQEYVDYYGNDDDVAVYRLQETGSDGVKSAFKDTEMVTTPVNGIIEKVLLVNENQQIFKGGIEQYNVWLTRGIIFFANGREISFEKDNIPFSEEIIIQRGYNLIDKFSDEKEFLTSWGEEVTPQCHRQIEEVF